MFVNLFGKDCGNYTRYWISVSTERWDAKKNKGTGEYIRASLSASLSADASEVFKENSKKTANKKIRGGRFEVKGAFFKAVEPKEGEPFVTFYIHDMAPVEDEEEDDRNDLTALGRYLIDEDG